MPSSIDYIERQGLVAMLDVLGTRNMDIEATKVLLTSLHAWVQLTQDEILRLRSVKRKSSIWNAPNAYPVTTFGDTVILRWDCTSDRLPDYLESVANHLTLAFFTAFKLGIKVRGALSFGKHIDHEISLLGPSISTAAEWYDKADWMGVVLTPALSLQASLIDETEQLPFPIEDYFPQYKVPMSHGGFRDLRVLDWTELYQYDDMFVDMQMSELEPLARFIKLLVRSTNMVNYGTIETPIIPYGTENKYSNTIDFAKWGLARERSYYLKKDDLK